MWANCLRYNHPLVHNSYSSLPGKKGCRRAHVPILRGACTTHIKRWRNNCNNGGRQQGAGLWRRWYWLFPNCQKWHLILLTESLLKKLWKKRKKIKGSFWKILLTRDMPDRYFEQFHKYQFKICWNNGLLLEIQLNRRNRLRTSHIYEDRESNQDIFSDTSIRISRHCHMKKDISQNKGYGVG